MANFDMSKLWLGKDGYYRDVNGNKVAQKGQALTGAAWRYLESKYGRDYANRASMNTRNGNIFQNGQWRFNNDGTSAKGTRDKYGYKQINPFTGKETYLNQDSRSAAVQDMKRNGKWSPNQKQQNKESITDEGPSSLGGKFIKWFGDKTGLYHAGNGISDLAGTGAYFIPGVGSALSAADAIDSFSKGNYGDALLNAAFAIPFVGSIGKGLRTGLKAANLVKSANAVGKGIRYINKVDPLAKKALNVKMTYDLPKMGKDLYDTYNTIAQQKKEISDQIRNSNLTDQQLKNALGENYESVKRLTSRDNSFLGNMGSVWDILTKT